MSRGFHVSEVIERPPHEVWSFLVDWSKSSLWMPGVDSMRPVGDGPIGTGTKLEFTARGAVRESTIVVWHPPREVTLQSTQGGLTATYSYSCTPIAKGTEVTLDAQCEARGMLWRAMRPLIAIMIKRADSVQLARLKEAICAIAVGTSPLDSN